MEHMDDAPKYWYCIKHQRVEGDEGCRAIHRLGPFDTPEEAAHALDIAAERNEEWDSDPRWNDPDDPDRIDGQ